LNSNYISLKDQTDLISLTINATKDNHSASIDLSIDPSQAAELKKSDGTDWEGLTQDQASLITLATIGDNEKTISQIGETNKKFVADKLVIPGYVYEEGEASKIIYKITGFRNPNY